MAQIPRPFQLALVAVLLLAGVWVFALQGHSSAPTTVGSSTAPEVTSTVSAAPAPAGTSTRHHTSSIHSSVGKASAGAKHPTRGGHVSHAATPARTGSSRTAAEVHKSTASKPESHPHKVSPATPQHRTTSTTGSTSSTSRTSGPGAASATSSRSKASPSGDDASASGAATHTAAPVTRHASSATKNASALAAPTGQREVEGELKQGKIVVLLFWNPAGSDDQIVHKELQLLLAVHHLASKAKAKEVQRTDRFFGLELDTQIAVHEARASQVAQYGSITRGVQIYATPTLLVINPKGQAIVRTGLTDAYAIEQAIEEVRAASA